MAAKKVLRAMAFERAIGELRACLATFASNEEPTETLRQQEGIRYLSLRKLVEDFENEVRDDGLVE